MAADEAGQQGEKLKALDFKLMFSEIKLFFAFIIHVSITGQKRRCCKNMLFNRAFLYYTLWADGE